MIPPQHFKLIDGTFSPAEAREVLLNLVKSKIDSHSLRLASDRERFGYDAARSELRIKQLKELQDALKELLAAAAGSDQELAINGWIEIAAAPGMHCTSSGR